MPRASVVLGIGVLACFGVGWAIGALTAPAPRPPAPPSLEEALRLLPAPGATDHTGSVCGLITAADGTPAPGVRVRCAPILPIEAPVDEAGAAAWMARVQRWRDRQVCESLTAADGMFRVEGLAWSAYRVEVVEPASVVEPIDAGAAGAAWPGMRVDFRAAGTVPTRFDLRRADGRVPEPAELLIESQVPGWERRAVAWQADAAPLELPMGTYRITAYERYALDAPPPLDPRDRSGPRTAEWRSVPRTCTVSPFNSAVPPPFVLTRHRGVSGRLPGTARSRVFAAPSAGPEPLTLAELRHQAVFDTWGPLDGRFDFRDLAPGWWTIGAASDFRGALIAVGTVQVTDGVARLDLQARAIGAPPLRVQVHDADGVPVDDCAFELTLFQAHDPWTREVRAVKAADGTYEFETDTQFFPTVAEWLSTGESGAQASLAVISPSRGTTRVAIPAWPPAPLVIQLAPPVPVELAVEGAEALRGRLAGALWPVASAFHLPPGHTLAEDATLDDRGRRAIGPLSPGDYWAGLWVLHEEIQWGRREVRAIAAVPVRVRVTPETRTVVVPAPVLHRVEVRVATGLRRRANVELRSLEPSRYASLRVQYDGGATVVFTEVPAGRYFLRAGDSGLLKQVDVFGEVAVELTVPALPQIDAIRIDLLDGAGALARAGFRTGDLWIGMDDTEFRSRNEIGMIGFALQAARVARIHVLRDGRRLTIAVDAPSLLGEASGARLSTVDRRHPEDVRD